MLSGNHLQYRGGGGSASQSGVSVEISCNLQRHCGGTGAFEWQVANLSGLAYRPSRSADLAIDHFHEFCAGSNMFAEAVLLPHHVAIEACLSIFRILDKHVHLLDFIRIAACLQGYIEACTTL